MPRSYMKGYIGAAKYTFDRASYKFYRTDLEDTMKSFKSKMLDFEAKLVWSGWVVLAIEI